jgi:Zn-dependent peptidase ImmA (M78 family)
LLAACFDFSTLFILTAAFSFFTMFKSLILASALYSAQGKQFSQAHELDHYTFDQYLSESNKKYSGDEEYSKRLGIFTANLLKIKTHNDEKRSWKMGVNKFTDMTEKELAMSFGGDKFALHNNKKVINCPITESFTYSLPHSLIQSPTHLITHSLTHYPSHHHITHRIRPLPLC